MVCTQLHSCIDIFYACNAICIDTNCFVDHRNKDSVYNETSCFIYLYRSLADLNGDCFDLFHNLFRSVQTCNNLNQLHNRSGIEEMHADNRTIQASADLCDGQRGCVGSKDAVCLADVLQLFECLLLDLHVFQSSFYNQIAICADGLNACCDLSQNSVSSFLSHFAFCNSLLKALCNFLLAVCSELFVDIAKKYFIAFGLSESLCDAGTHCAGANNTYLHDVILLIFY